jgi:hypothetical protein
MIAGLPYTTLRDAMLTHPTLVEGLIPLFSSIPLTSGRKEKARDDYRGQESSIGNDRTKRTRPLEV